MSNTTFKTSELRSTFAIMAFRQIRGIAVIFKLRLLSLCLVATSLSCALSQPSAAINVEASRDTQVKQSPEARKLAAKVIEAYGGAEKIRNLDRLMYKAQGLLTESSMLSGAENSFDCLIFSKGDKTRIELNMLGKQVVTAYNGSTSWVKQGDNVFPTDPTTAKHVQMEVEHGLKLLERITEKDAFVALGEVRNIDGQQCPSLYIKAADGKYSQFFMDPSTYLVIRNEYPGQDLEQGMSVLKSSIYADYRPAFGTLLPFKTIDYNNGKKSTEIALRSIELVPDGNDSVFEMPAEIPLASLKGGPVKIPFEYRANEIMIKAKINGTTDALLILDTGATTTILDGFSATAFGAPKSSDYKMTTGSGTIKTGSIVLSSLALGDIQLKDTAVAISNLSGFLELPSPRPIGIIGADILRRFLVKIDYENKVLTLSDPHQVQIPADAIVVPTEPALGASGLVVSGKLDGQPLTFLVDTGAAFNNVSEKLVARIVKTPLLPVGKVEGLDGQKVSIGAVAFKTLKLGNATIKNPVFSIAPQEAAGVQKGIIVNGSLAILGNPLWSQYTLTVDYRNQRLFLQKSKEREQRELAAEEIRELESRYYRTRDASNTASQLKELSKKFDAKGWPAPSAVCLAKSALYSAIALKSANTAPKGVSTDAYSEINKSFSIALAKASASKDKPSRAEVLSANAIYLLKYSVPPNSTDARFLLIKAIIDAPTLPALNMAAYWLAKDLQMKKSGPVLDQILMLDPSCWDALWERYNDAKAHGNSQEMTLIADQLKRYYSGIPDVDALSTTFGAKEK